MTTLEFKISINASKEKVWKILWSDSTYRQWMNVFCAGAYAVSDWKEGDKIYFLSPSGDGMNSIIETKRDNEYIAFKHISDVKNFNPVPLDESSKEWTGAMETYQLTFFDNQTEIEVKIDTLPVYIDFFKKAFPKGLEMVKKLSEV